MPHEEDYTFRLHDRVRSRFRTCTIVARFHTRTGEPLYVVESVEGEGELHIASPHDLVHVGPPT